MPRHKVVLAIYTESENEQDALDIVDAALVDVLFDYDERIKSRHMLWVEDAPNTEDDEEEDDSPLF